MDTSLGGGETRVGGDGDRVGNGDPVSATEMDNSTVGEILRRWDLGVKAVRPAVG